ncbi:MAG: hypothetical protein ABIM74_07695 [candidate division WOR-3 bacterium]
MQNMVGFWMRPENLPGFIGGLLVSLAIMVGPLFSAYEFSDTSFAISVVQGADWNCVSDMKRDGSGLLEFSGRGLEVVVFYGSSPKLRTSEGAVRAFLEEAGNQIDSLKVISADTITLWGMGAYQATYAGFAEDTSRVGRIYSLVQGERFVTLIFVKKGAKTLSDKDEYSISEFIRGIEVKIKRDGG